MVAASRRDQLGARRQYSVIIFIFRRARIHQPSEIGNFRRAGEGRRNRRERSGLRVHRRRLTAAPALPNALGTSIIWASPHDQRSPLARLGRMEEAPLGLGADRLAAKAHPGGARPPGAILAQLCRRRTPAVIPIAHLRGTVGAG
jgi:hypothetical protein